MLIRFSPGLFSRVFGCTWRPAGALARILAQRVELLWQVALFVMTIAVFLAPLTLHDRLLGYAMAHTFA